MGTVNNELNRSLTMNEAHHVSSEHLTVAEAGWTTAYVTKASSIGCRAGFWPRCLIVDGKIGGNGRPFYQARKLSDGGIEYRQEFGCVSIRVLND